MKNDKPQFTPGPWEVVKHNCDKQTTAYYINNSYHPRPEAEANAHLIAAAPEMLEALESFVRSAECVLQNAADTGALFDPDTEEIFDDFKDLEADVFRAKCALAKARGES